MYVKFYKDWWRLGSIIYDLKTHLPDGVLERYSLEWERISGCFLINVFWIIKLTRKLINIKCFRCISCSWITSHIPKLSLTIAKTPQILIDIFDNVWISFCKIFDRLLRILWNEHFWKYLSKERKIPLLSGWYPGFQN